MTRNESITVAMIIFLVLFLGLHRETATLLLLPEVPSHRIRIVFRRLTNLPVVFAFIELAYVTHINFLAQIVLFSDREATSLSHVYVKIREFCC